MNDTYSIYDGFSFSSPIWQLMVRKFILETVLCFAGATNTVTPSFNVNLLLYDWLPAYYLHFQTEINFYWRMITTSFFSRIARKVESYNRHTMNLKKKTLKKKHSTYLIFILSLDTPYLYDQHTRITSHTFYMRRSKRHRLSLNDWKIEYP